MSLAIFRDDSTLEDKRDAAIDRLIAMCPAGLRIAIRPMVVNAVDNASEAELDALMLQVDGLRTMAESGDVDGIINLAREHGATDSQIAMLRPMFVRSA